MSGASEQANVGANGPARRFYSHSTHHVALLSIREKDDAMMVKRSRAGNVDVKMMQDGLKIGPDMACQFQYHPSEPLSQSRTTRLCSKSD